MSTGTMITDEMLALVDRPMRQATSYPIGANDIRRWALAVYYPAVPPRLFWDDQYAATTPWGGIVAPQEFNPFAWATQDPPLSASKTSGGPGRWGHFESVFGVEPPPYRAVLQSRVIANYSPVRMRPGDVIHSEDRISEYFERDGKMGLQLYTTISVDYVNQRDEWIKRLDTVFVRYR
jgi:N-terminal half of MaoC dehydratase